jgi:hypothetical protein
MLGFVLVRQSGVVKNSAADELGHLAQRLAKSKTKTETAQLTAQITAGFYAGS